MNELVRDKKTAYILISALVVVLLGAVYYFVLHPLKNEKESKEVSIEVLQGEVAALKEEYSSSQLQDDSSENAFYLKTQVPLTRELNELIRSIEEVELLSESKILSVEFNNYDGTIEDAQLLPETSEENTETETQSEGVLTDELSEEPPVSPVAEASLPEKLKLITFNISILTKNYDSLVLFVEEIEHLKRIYRVDQITLSAPGEEQLLDEEVVNDIAAKIQLTTFYHDE
ncbi:hypothetical protein [Psychrobacillus psychrodurans]|uniref:hypothetical protein n=1 Tax=Psychrobacillus psychrodurans TaxID=126157 RepID=UPI0008EBBF20|nr:hypothetical protein [Psychrobacillus psychrodurans]MCZ8542135.1 hypothetical protein [Psychrobacillus psychrodurans]SFN17514.1 hypothetical protein SAMN05421832_11827 [Psychrobacillus psychrodurans]